MDWLLKIGLVICFGSSHCTYSYFEKDVVKLVDFVDTIDWIDFNELILEGGSKVKRPRRQQQLYLYNNSSTTFAVKKFFKYLLLKSSCTRKSGTFKVSLDDASMSQSLLFSSCNNDSWIFQLDNYFDGVLKVKSLYPKEILVQKIGMGNVTKDKTLGKLHENGKARLEELGRFSKQQVLVAILGLRGSGKSTIVSLLSGNDEMFRQGRRSTRTTTLGIDISPVIPTDEYIPAVNYALQNNFTDNSIPFPLVFTDSEGMGVRGDSIDFVSTIPPLLFSNVIMWVTTDSLRSDEELNKLDRYLNLANRIQDDSGSLCTDFKGGRLIVVVNKMQGNESDEELTDELLEEEFESESESATKRDSIRKKLKNCFKTVQAIGFPYLSLPEEEEYLKYVNIRGKGSGRFRQSLTKLISMILNEQNEIKFLAGTIITPNVLSNLYEIVLEKINTEAEFLDNDLLDALFTFNIKQNLTKHEVLIHKYLTEIERSKKNEALVEAVGFLINENKNILKVLMEESKNERQRRTVMAEWNIVDAGLTETMEKMIFFNFNTTLSEIHSLLAKLLPICRHLPAQEHYCLESYFSGRLSESRVLMKKLPEEISKRVYSVLESIDREKEKIFSMCSVQRMSFAYTERDDAEVFFREGIDIIKPVTSKKDLNGALETFANLRTKIMKRKHFGFPALISPCNMSHPSQKGHKMIEHIESSFGSSLGRLKHSMEFPVRTNQLETEFEFSSVFPKNISNGETTRIFDHLCDLPLILSTLPLHIKELKLICYRLKAYGYSSTSLRMLSIEVGYLDIHNMGSTVYLTKPLAPPKSKPGKLGEIGCSGGVVLVKVHFEVSGGVLNIEANGGDGGEGGDGTAGSQGADGLYYTFLYHVAHNPKLLDKSYYDGLLNYELKVAHEDKQPVDTNKDKLWFCYLPLIVNNLACISPEYRAFLKEVHVTYRNRILFDTKFEYFNSAWPGNKGARGNPGQTGGNGGDPGKLQLDVPVTFRKHFTLLALGGKAGKGGKGGPGGPGGTGGRIEVLEVRYVRVWEQHEKFIYKTKEHHKSGEVQSIEVSGGKMISSSLHFPGGHLAREIGRKKDGEIGEIGENGKDGIENKIPSQTEFSPITESVLFSIFKEINSFSLKEKEEGRHKGERSIQNIITYIENMLDNASNQKNVFSNLRSKNLKNLLEMEVNLAQEFMQTTKNIQNSLRVDLRKYKNSLSSVQDQISQFDVGSLKHITDKFRGELFKQSQSHLEQGNEQKKNKQQFYFEAVHIITNIVNIALPVFGIGYKNQEGAKTGFKKLLNSTHKFIFDEIRSYSKNLDLAFEDYFLFIEENYNKTKKLSNKIKTFVNNISKEEIRNQMNLGVQVFDLMKDYNPNTFVTSDINSRLKRLEARKVISRLKSVVFQASSQLGAQNIPELDSLIKLIDMKVDFAEKVAEVTSAISDLQLTIDRVKQRKEMLRKHFEAKVDHLTSIYDPSDSINTNAMLILFSIGKQLYSGLSSLINTAAHARQSTEFLSKIPPFSPLSSPDKLRRVLNILKNELNTVKIMHDGEITVVLNEMDFPYEFELLRTKRHAVFPVFDKKKGDIWIESVKAILNNISSEGMYYMTSIEHSGSVLFDLGDDLKLEPAVFESVYSVPGPEWIFSPVSVYNNIELINYPFSSYYKISIPENHTSVNIVSNINLNMSSFRQIELIFKVWYKN